MEMKKNNNVINIKDVEEFYKKMWLNKKIENPQIQNEEVKRINKSTFEKNWLHYYTHFQYWNNSNTFI